MLFKFDSSHLMKAGKNFSVANYLITVLFLALPVWATPSTCSGGPQQVFTVGATGSLTASSTGGSGTITYAWTQASYTQPGISTQAGLTFGSPSSQTTTISGYVFGPVNVTVTCTDSVGGGSLTSTVHHGAVQTDRAGNIQYIGTYSTKINTLLGPQTIMDRSCDIAGGSCTPTSLNPWPWEDQLQFNWGYHFGQAQGTNPIPSINLTRGWETRTGSGTVTIANGSTALTGTSGAFAAEFCGGGGTPCTPVNATGYIVIWYCISGTAPSCFSSDTTSGRRYKGLSVLTNGTATLSSAWELATCTNCYYTAWPTDQGGNSWIFTNNYYDNVKSFYISYYRTGIEDYLGYARWLADAWYDSPYTDQLTCADGGSGFACPFPRNVAPEGIVLNALDEDAVAGSAGASRKWTGLRRYWDFAMSENTRCASVDPTVGACYDIREESYLMAAVGLCAITDPSDATRVTNCLTNGQTLLTRWSSQRQADGSWVAPYCTTLSHAGFCDFTGSLGTVTATNGSTAVTLSGGTWTDATQFCGGGSLGTAGNHKAYVILGTLPGTLPDSANWDSRGYIATFVSTTSLTLDVNYAGTTASGKGILIGCNGGPDNWVGPTIQPFMLGITSNAMRLWAYAFVNSGSTPPFDATLASTINTTWLPGIATFLGTTAFDTDSHAAIPDRGPWYGVGGGSCESPYGPAGNADCSGGSTAAEIRALSPELMHSFTTAYCLTQDSNTLSYGNNYFSAMFAKFSGESGYDGGYVSDWDINGFFWGLYNGKWWGFFWGYGDNESWLAGRQTCGLLNSTTTHKGKVTTKGNVTRP